MDTDDYLNVLNTIDGLDTARSHEKQRAAEKANDGSRSR